MYKPSYEDLRKNRVLSGSASSKTVRKLTVGLHVRSVGEQSDESNVNVSKDLFNWKSSSDVQFKQPQVMPIKGIMISRWTKFSQIITCCIPSIIISCCCGKKGTLHQQGNV